MKTKNLTPFPFGAKVTSFQPPELAMTLIVRARFSLRPGQPLVPLGQPVEPGARGEGEPAAPVDHLAQGFMTSEVFREDDEERAKEALYPGDFADFKIRPDLLLRGTCHAPGGRPVTECPVRFSVGAWSKTLRVVGRRVWSDGYGGAVMSSPLPFVKMPVDYAHAFGGPGYPQNPAGKGFGTSELPNVEHPGAPVRSRAASRAEKAEPASFGPLNAAWPQRRVKIGKEYGKSYQEKRAPFYAEDFDWTYFNAAPADQQLPAYLRGDEELAFYNLHPAAPVFASRLPGLRVRAFVKGTDGRFREPRMSLDTLFADLDEGTLTLTWRGLDRVREDDLMDVQTVLIVSEPLADAPLPASHYQERLEAFERDPLSLAEHTPKGLPDLAEAQKKLAALAAATAALRGPGDPSDPAARLKPILELMNPPGMDRAELTGSVMRGIGSAGEHAAPHLDLSGALARAANDVQATMPGPKPVTPGVLPPLQAPGRQALQTLGKRVAELKKVGAQQQLPAAELDKLDAMMNDPALAQLGAEPPGERPPGPGQDLSGRDFSHRDLRGADLRGADLTLANFTGADLSGAQLAGANLTHGLLFDVVIERADLSGADLTLANLTGARARGANLSGARLDKTLLDKADLEGANLAGATGASTLFQTATLAGAKAHKARFEQAYFDGGNLERADFSQAVLHRCLISKSNARQLNLGGAMLVKTSFADSDLTQAIFVEARGEGVVLLRTILDGADFSHASLPGAHFTEARATKTNFFAANLKNGRFYRAALERAEFVQANLFAADFRKARLAGARFNGSNLYDSRFIQAAGAGCDFTDANLKRSTLERT